MNIMTNLIQLKLSFTTIESINLPDDTKKQPHISKSYHFYELHVIHRPFITLSTMSTVNLITMTADNIIC